jgi:uncharacterized membrane protein YccC
MHIGFREINFALKSYAGAMLAALISFELDLERPSWAILTAYIVAQPYAGMVQSKALYRVLGTLGGGIFAVAALGNMSSTPELLALVLALWLGLCVYFSLLDRTARSYAFMLAGYTASIICFPSVDTPGVIFDTAVSRCEEIILGIICALVANQLLFPQSAGKALQLRLDAWIADAGTWCVNVLRQHSRGDAALADQNRLLSDSLALNALREHAVFDTPALRNAQAWMFELQRRMQGLMAVLVSIEDRLSTLRRDRPDLLPPHLPLLEQIAAYIEQGRDTPPEQRIDRSTLLAAIDAITPPDRAVLDDADMLLFATLTARLKDLIRYWNQCRKFRKYIAEGRGAPIDAVPLALHSDQLMAVLGGVAAAVAVLACNTFWVLSAWPGGAGAVIQAGVICAIFAASDNPVALAMKFQTGTVIGVLIAAFYVLVILPGIDGVPLLIFSLAWFYLPIGVMLALPSLAPTALPVVLAFTTAVGLQNAYKMGFDDFLNSAIAMILGITAATLILRIFRSFGGDWTVNRLIGAVRRDLARSAVGSSDLDRATYESRMFDRLNNLAMRRRPDNPQIEAIRGALGGLRAGLNLFLLDETAGHLSPLAEKSVRRTRAELARLFRNRRAGVDQLRQACALIQASIADIALGAPTPKGMQAVLALGGLRLLLRRHASFFCHDAGATLHPITEVEAT